MIKRLVTGLATSAAVLALGATTATAQEGPTISVDPPTVDAAGMQEFTVTGSGFTVEALSLLPCIPTEDLTTLDATGGDCDLSAITPVTPTDGAFEVTVTFDVPAEGISVVVGDAAQTEGAFVVVTVGGDGAAAEEPADDGAEEPADDAEAPAEDGDGDDDGDGDGDGDEAADTSDEDQGGEPVADTGIDPTTPVLLGSLAIVAGLALFGFRRRLA